MKTKFKFTAFAMAIFVTGCGDFEKDPLKNHEVLRKSRPAVEEIKPQGDQMTIPTLFSITKEGESQFVQGEETKLTLRVQTFFSQPVPYTLNVIEKPEGSRLTKATNDTWIFAWKPSTLLTAEETERPYKLRLAFQPQSPLGRAEFAGADPYTEFELTLIKDKAQPHIEENIRLSPGSEVNANQKVTISFVVAANGITKPDDIKIQLFGGAETPSQELVQVNGLWGVMGLPERVRTLGRDNQGRLRQQYSVTFEAEPFAQKVLRKIHESDYHKAKFQRGDLKQAEAFFYIKAVNAYNNLSDTETVNIKVNLVAQAGEARFEGEPQVQSLNVGRELTHFFNIRSRGDRGEVSVQSVSLDDTALELKDGAYAFSQDSVTGSLSCKPIARALRDDYGCDGVSCVMNCALNVQTTCDSREQVLTLKIATISVLGQDKKEKTLEYKVNIKGKAPSCLERDATRLANGGSNP